MPRPELQTETGSGNAVTPMEPFSLQTKAFAKALLDPGLPVPEGVGRNGSPAPRRYGVYRNNVMVSLMEGLSSAYPSVLAIMGRENFDRLARIFVRACPPTSPMMQQFGKQFSEFLQDFKPLRSSPFLVDVAKAERAWLEAWHALDETPLTPAELGAVAPDDSANLKLRPMRATALISSNYPVCTLFNARNEWPVSGIDLDENQSLLVTRPLLECIATPLDRPNAVFVENLIDGHSLGEAVSQASKTDGRFDPANAIALILQTGAFVSLDDTEN